MTKILASMEFCELIPDLALALRQFLRNIYLHGHVEIAALSAAGAGLSLTGKANALSFVNAARNLYLIILDLVRAAATQRNRAGRSVQRFFERDQNVGFDIGPALGRRFASAESAESRAT